MIFSLYEKKIGITRYKTFLLPEDGFISIRGMKEKNRYTNESVFKKPPQS